LGYGLIQKSLERHFGKGRIGLFAGTTV